MTNQPSPDMGQSVSDAVVEAARLAWIADCEPGCCTLGEPVLSHLRAALTAAERLRAPVGGDGKSDQAIWFEEQDKAWGQDKFLNLNIEPLVLQMMEIAALAAMARVRCAITDDTSIGAEIARHAEKPYPQWVEPGIYYISLASEINARFASRHHHVSKLAATTLPIAKVDER